MLTELDFKAAGENGAAPAGLTLSCDGENSVGGLANGSAASWSGRGSGGVGGGRGGVGCRVNGDLGEGVEELGGVEVLLGLGLPLGVAVGGFLVVEVVLLGLDFLLLFPSRRIPSSIGGGYGIRNQSRCHGV